MLPLIAYFIRRLGFGAGLKMLGTLAKGQKRPFSGFASERFFSAAPIACGPFAVRVRLMPSAAPPTNQAADFADELRRQLTRGPITYDLQLQFFVDETSTPIEDAAVDWPESTAPYVTVARLTLPAQELEGQTASELSSQIEGATFDPWEALAEHRPLGKVMRARRATYFKSQRARGIT